MVAVLGNAILAFLESTEGGTLLDLRRFLIDKSFRARFLETVQDEQVISYLAGRVHPSQRSSARTDSHASQHLPALEAHSA